MVNSVPRRATIGGRKRFGAFTADLIERKDYDDWRYVWFDNNRVSLRDVISETECEQPDSAAANYGVLSDFRNMTGGTSKWSISPAIISAHRIITCMRRNSTDTAISLFGEWEEEEMMALKAEWETEQLFRDAQGDNLPVCAQDFFYYWHDGPHTEDFAWLTYQKEWLQ